MRSKASNLICLIDNCQEKVTTRGLCKSHYNLLNRRVNANLTTWREAEENGECLSRINKKGGFEDVHIGSDYTKQEIEFLKAVTKYQGNRKFMTATDYLKILLRMGYKKEIE